MTDNALARLSAATLALAEAKTLDEIKQVRDVAVAAQTYARAAKLGLEAQNHAAEVKLRAERRAGELLAQLERDTAHGGGPGRGIKTPSHDVTGFSEYSSVLDANEINRMTAHRWQTIAALPDEVFEETIAGTVAARKELTTAGVLGVAKDVRRQTERDELMRRVESVKITPVSNGLNTVSVCDIYDLRLPDESIDMVFTDPPYHDEYVSLYERLAEVAASALKPGGYCMAYVGKIFLPDVMAAMGKRLEYVNTFCVFQPDNNSKIHKHNIFEAWRPIVAYKRPGATSVRRWQPDAIRQTRDKSFHEWQQGIEPPLRYIEAYTNPGDVVLDPFIGGGTTAVASVRLGRRFVAFDANTATVAIAIERINSEAVA